MTEGEARVSLCEDFIEDGNEFDDRVDIPYQQFLRSLSPSPLVSVEQRPINAQLADMQSRLEDVEGKLDRILELLEGQDPNEAVDTV